MIVPLLLIVGGVAVFTAFVFTADDDPVPDYKPDLPPNAPPPAGFPSSTRYRKVDAILAELKKASDASGIPLGVLVGWIAKESGGNIGPAWPAQKPKPLKGQPDSERGYFQLTPEESAKLGLDLEGHKKLSVDPQASINAGLALIGRYMGVVEKLGIASRGSTYYWKLVKLVHTMGTGATQKIVAAAKAAGKANTWTALEDYALDHNAELLSATKHSPKKWFPLVDEVAEVGAPFGFGDATAIVGAGPAFNDIIDPLDCLKA